jgi:2-polyprenyl-3-methyl-5-hydroxy-6-metoxy-1,4-benzoquinol methylase
MIPERLVLEQEKNSALIRMHLARYEFAKGFVNGKSVLDVACGSGYGSAMLKRAGASKVVGIDISSQTIEYAKTHFHDDRIEFVIGDAENLASYRGFEVAISFETIEHLQHPEIFLEEIALSLAPRGTLIISTPHRESGKMFVKHQNPYHIREWTLEEFKELLSKHFQVTNIYGQYNFKKKWLPYSRTLQRFVFHTFFPDGFKALDNYPCAFSTTSI